MTAPKNPPAPDDPAFRPMGRPWEHQGLVVAGNYPDVHRRTFGISPRSLFPEFFGTSMEFPEVGGPILVVFGTEEDAGTAQAYPNYAGSTPRTDGTVGYRFSPLEVPLSG